MTVRTKKYRAVVIGCGKIGALLESDPHRPKPATHAGAFTYNKNTQLVALVDRNRTALAGAARLFPNAARYRDAQACLKMEKPDIAAVATDAASHLRLVRACIAAGVRMIICEKPLGATLSQARSIEKVVARSGTTLVLNHQRRFSALFRDIRRQISRNKLGRIQQVTCYYSNGLLTNASHSIDAATYLLGDSIRSVVGLWNLKNRTHPAGDRNIDALLTTRRGTTIALQSFDQRQYGIFTLHIFGSKAAVTISDFGFGAHWYTVQPSIFKSLNQLGIASGRQFYKTESATAGAVKHAIASFARDKAPVSTAKTGRETMEIVAALQRSASRGGAVMRVS
jgi:predicted dehydrogenase